MWNEIAYECTQDMWEDDLNSFKMSLNTLVWVHPDHPAVIEYNNLLSSTQRSTQLLSREIEANAQVEENQKLSPALSWNKYFISLTSQTDFSQFWKWLAFRKNNPGSLTWEKWFAKFESIEQWIQKLVDKITRNQNNGVIERNGSRYHGNMTLLEYFRVYCPTAEHIRYARQVKERLQLPDFNVKIKDINPIDFACAIIKKENGKAYTQLKKLWIISSLV